MTDTLVDDDLIETRSSTHRPTTSTSTSSATTTRRPMYIETEVRTDSVTTRRMASAAANRSIYDVLEKTKSPVQDHQSTSYTYAHSNSYVPGSRSSNYDIPVMARRNLHSEYQRSTLSSIAAAILSPSQLLSNVRSQLWNGYSAVCNRVSRLAGYHHPPSSSSPIRSVMTSGTRFSRSSSQSSTSGGRTIGYNLRSRPVHSTPRDVDNEQQRKIITKTRKDTQQREEIDDDGDDHQRQQHYFKTAIYYSKKIFHLPIGIFDIVWYNLKGLPWWLLIPLLIFLSLYALPYLACKPFERYHHSKVNKFCRDIHYYTNDLTSNTYAFARRHTYERGVRNFKQFYRSTTYIKDSVLSSLSNVFSSIKTTLWTLFGGMKNRIVDVVRTTTDNAKESYDAGIQKVNSLIKEWRQERKFFLRARYTLSSDQEKDLGELVKKLINEYAADETGQADYALEANGGKVIETRCQEYTDEPRQNVVKFLGIPIVHRSKEPDIIIKHGRMPGQCFPFKGDHGSVVIRLAVPVTPTEFVLEHLSKSLSIVGHINSAPNNFTVYALKNKSDRQGIVLGRYSYDAENGPALQRFRPQIANVPVVEYIEIQVTSNWGNPTYTCLYRFRVHGDMKTIAPTTA